MQKDLRIQILYFAVSNKHTFETALDHESGNQHRSLYEINLDKTISPYCPFKNRANSWSLFNFVFTSLEIQVEVLHFPPHERKKYLQCQFEPKPVLVFILTLIIMGKAKFDLANFDIKLQENLLFTFKKIPIPAEMPCKSLFYFIHNVKKWHLMYILLS